MEDESLNRFIKAQNQFNSYNEALIELRAGCKTSHWIWYAFPQIVGLGRSDMATYFGIHGLEEAKAYLNHPILGPRLHEAAKALLDCGNRDPVDVLVRY